MIDPLSIGLGLGGAAATLFGGRKEPNLSDLERMFGAQAEGKRAQELFQILASSPMFRNQLGRTNIAGQQLGQGINANLARAGLLNSGVGALGAALGDSAAGFAREDLIGKLSQMAIERGGNINQILASLFTNTRQTGPTQLQMLGGSALGAAGQRFASARPAGGNNSAPSFDPFFQFQ